MIRQCAWCGKTLGQIAPVEDAAITHGLCEACCRDCLEPSEDAQSATNPEGGREETPASAGVPAKRIQ